MKSSVTHRRGTSLTLSSLACTIYRADFRHHTSSHRPHRVLASALPSIVPDAPPLGRLPTNTVVGRSQQSIRSCCWSPISIQHECLQPIRQNHTSVVCLRLLRSSQAWYRSIQGAQCRRKHTITLRTTLDDRQAAGIQELQVMRQHNCRCDIYRRKRRSKISYAIASASSELTGVPILWYLL